MVACCSANKHIMRASVTGENRGRGIGEDCIGKGGCKGLQKRFHRAQRGQHSVAICAGKEVCAKAEAGQGGGKGLLSLNEITEKGFGREAFFR